jgi:hypothetical protein
MLSSDGSSDQNKEKGLKTDLENVDAFPFLGSGYNFA